MNEAEKKARELLSKEDTSALKNRIKGLAVEEIVKSAEWIYFYKGSPDAVRNEAYHIIEIVENITK